MRENGCEKSAELSGAGAARWGGRGRLDGRTPGGWRQSRQPLQNLHFGDVLTRKLQKYLAIVFYTSYSRNLHKLNLWTNIKKTVEISFFCCKQITFILFMSKIITFLILFVALFSTNIFLSFSHSFFVGFSVSGLRVEEISQLQRTWRKWYFFI